MTVLLLGQVTLSGRDGREIAVSGAKRRGVLALLAHEAGRVVTVPEIEEFLWEQPPQQARAVIQGHIVHLRRQLAPAGLSIETRASGYLMQAADDGIDVSDADEFRRAAERPKDTDPGYREQLGSALSLWRGSALAGLAATPAQRSLAAALEELRTRTLERWAAAELAAGHAERAVPMLEKAVRADVLREPLIAVLIDCLAQVGRVSDAEDLYERTAELLGSSLGIDPGPRIVEAMRRLRGDVPAHEPADSAAASSLELQVPRQTDSFVGRASALKDLDRIVGGDGRSVAIVVGPAGVGKSALAAQWARSASARFPDGVLFADLRGFDPAGPANPLDVLGALLTALGHAESELPVTAQARAELLQRTTADLRLLIVLDNAASAEQVAELVLFGTRCTTIVTSRHTLGRLQMEAAGEMVVLGPLDTDDALALLEHGIGAERVREQTAAAAEIIEFCDRLPLALHLCAARLAMRPTWRLADLAAELADERGRLAALDADESTRIEAAFALSRSHLNADASRLLPLLALHPGREVDAFSAAALLGIEVGAARRTLGELAAYHLTDEASPGWHLRHDLVRSYCARLLEAETTTEDVLAVRFRLLEYYAASLRAAINELRHDTDEELGPTNIPFRRNDSRRAADWIRREAPTIRALLASAVELGIGGPTWRVAWPFSHYYYYAENNESFERITTLGLTAAEQANSDEGRAYLLSSKALSHMRRGEAAEALAALREATELADRSAPVECRLLVSTRLGNVLVHSERVVEGIAVYEDVLALSESAGKRSEISMTLMNLADALNLVGEPERSLQYSARALAMIEDHEIPAAIVAYGTMAQSQTHLRLFDDARDSASKALAISRKLGMSYLECMCLQLLARIAFEDGAAPGATDLVRSAVDLLANLDIKVDAFCDLLDDLEHGVEHPRWVEDI